jgi:DNA-binding CsgD family transcriptional regulator
LEGGAIPAGSVGTGFVGRDRELVRLRTAWEDAQAGKPRVCGIIGAPGIGKTALVREFVRKLQPTTRASAVGDSYELALPWGVLRQIGLDIPAVAAFADTLDALADPALVARTLATVLGDVGPAVLVIDDAHWGDTPSMTALRLAVRWLGSAPVLMVFAFQEASADSGAAAIPGPAGAHAPDVAMDPAWDRVFDTEYGDRLRLDGLSALELVRLAAAMSRPGLSPAAAARLHAHTTGNPQHVRFLVDQLSLRTIAFGHGPLPAPRSLVLAVVSRLAACAPATRDFVAAGAVLGRAFGLSAAQQVSGIGEQTAAAAEEAVGAGLLEESPGTLGRELVFPSALTRDAVYHDLGRARRCELHRRAALVGGSDTVWHRIASADGPDEALAEDVDRAARLHRAQGRPASAAALLRHALNLTPAGPSRTPRLLSAVEALLVAGDSAAAREYEAELDAEDRGAWWDYVAGYQKLLAGQVLEARERFERALAGLRRDGQPPAPAPPDLEARIASQLAILGIVMLSYPDMVEYGELAVSAGSDEAWVGAFAWLARSLGLALAGRAREALDGLSAAGEPGAGGGLETLASRGIIRLWTDDLDGARRDLRAVVERASRGEALRMAQALGFLGEVEYRRGALDDATDLTEQAVGDAEENERFWDFALLHALACYPRAACGDWERAEQHAQRAAEWASIIESKTALAYAAAARAAIAQARDDAQRLLIAGQQFEAQYSSPEPGTHLFGPLRADALSLLGRPDEADEALTAFTAALGVSDRRSTLMSTARVRGQIAAARGDHDAAVHAFEEALVHAGAVGLPIEAGRIELLLAASFSASGRRAAAERSLRSAARVFGETGAAAYAAQAEDTARRFGLDLNAPYAALAALTRAERAVAVLVGEGLTNKEIAARLVLSEKTVETHLGRVYSRLDVRGRKDLRALLAGSQ